MSYEYEQINYENNLPFKVFFVSIARRNYHWHKELEIIWCIKGSVNIIIKDHCHKLSENTVAIINSNEIHGLRHDGIDDNILVAMQLKSEYLKAFIPDIDKMVFENKVLVNLYEENETVEVIKKHLVKIIENVNLFVNKENNYTIFEILASYNLLLKTLFENISYKVIDNEEKKNNYVALKRLNRILKYVNENYMNKISLRDIAEKEHLNKYYLSHFISNTLGMPFQEYLNKERLEKAIDLLLNTEERILDISFGCGFSDIKYLNNLLKKEYNCTAVQYRKQYSKIHFEIIDITNNSTEHLPLNYKECIKILDNMDTII